MGTSPVPTIGRIVLFVLPNGPRAGEIRPATVVRVLDDNKVNLQVHLDGPNDPDCPAWCGTVYHDQATKAKNTWHWMDYQLGKG